MLENSWFYLQHRCADLIAITIFDLSRKAQFIGLTETDEIVTNNILKSINLIIYIYISVLCKCNDAHIRA